MSEQNFVAWDDFDVDYQRLCEFACKYGFCPPDTCGLQVVDEWDDGSVDSDGGYADGIQNKAKNYEVNKWQCQVFKTPRYRDSSVHQCWPACRETVEAAQAAGRTTNYGCVGFWPLDEPIPWTQYSGSNDPDMVYATGRCVRQHPR